jgi:hypothetical protein
MREWYERGGGTRVGEGCPLLFWDRSILEKYNLIDIRSDVIE